MRDWWSEFGKILSFSVVKKTFLVLNKERFDALHELVSVCEELFEEKNLVTIMKTKLSHYLRVSHKSLNLKILLKVLRMQIHVEPRASVGEVLLFVKAQNWTKIYFQLLAQT